MKEVKGYTYALQTVLPSSSLRQSGVVVVRQLWQLTICAFAVERKRQEERTWLIAGITFMLAEARGTWVVQVPKAFGARAFMLKEERQL